LDLILARDAGPDCPQAWIRAEVPVDAINDDGDVMREDDLFASEEHLVVPPYIGLGPYRSQHGMLLGLGSVIDALIHRVRSASGLEASIA